MIRKILAHLDEKAASAGINMPCLLLRGEISDILSDEIVDRMTAVKPDLVCALIPNRSHAPMLGA